MTAIESAGKLDLVVTRTFEAPVDRVWKAWTEPEQVMRWWGPAGFTAPVARMNVREGETSLVCMRTPDGHDLYNTWTYRRVIPSERLEFLMGFADDNGDPVEPTDLGLPPDVPSRVRHIVTFEPVGETRTELSVTEFGYLSEQTRDISRQGLEECLDKMAASFSARQGG